jgi:hypothetical protein
MGRLSTVLLGVSLFTRISSVAAEAQEFLETPPVPPVRLDLITWFGEGLVHWTRPADDDHI